MEEFIDPRYPDIDFFEETAKASDGTALFENITELPKRKITT